MEISSPSPPITSLSTNITHLHNLCPLILCLICSSLLSVSWRPLTKKIAPQCVVDQVDIFYSSTSTFYAIAILVTRNKSKIFFMGRSTNCHPSKRSPKKCFSAFAAYVVVILMTHHYHQHHRNPECSPPFSNS